MSTSDQDRPAKRLKLYEDGVENVNAELPGSHGDLHPPSYQLLARPVRPAEETFQLREEDVGISEYISTGLAPIEGIIKQRFTDFLVFEVDQENIIVRLSNIERPVDEQPEKQAESGAAANDERGADPKTPGLADAASKEVGWSPEVAARLSSTMSPRVLQELEELVSQGPNYVPTSSLAAEKPSDIKNEEAEGVQVEGDGGKKGPKKQPRPKRIRNQKKGQERSRFILSDTISSKDDRSKFHQVIREAFCGRLDTRMMNVADPESGNTESKIAIQWAESSNTRGDGRSRQGNPSQPPFIHFTMQKTNRDTHDALSQLSRLLHINVKDLAVAGTKDKRGVTVQLVSLKRQNKTREDIWKMANGFGRLKTTEQILSERADRGIRIGNLVYRKQGLKLGMLNGNAFIITLRNVKFDSESTVNSALQSVKEKGFINYYGMQRFGTAAVPTHVIGLALLRSDWHLAVSLILRQRPGEHPDADAARRAWLEENDLDKALRLMPRRIVAERCILESYKKQKGDTRNAMGALSTIPRNLRLMYVHAYQSYVWNAIVSERIKRYGFDKPVPGDLVLEKASDSGIVEMEVDEQEVPETEEGAEQLAGATDAVSDRKRRYQAPRAKVLTEIDASRYSIFDVVMPLPGKDVAFPGGSLGELYREFLVKDGLDPDNFDRKQKDYLLGGSYRKVLHLPRELSWELYRYTDPELPLAQADEDMLLGFKPVAEETDGKFRALQIRLTLGTAAYATMALREVLKTDTSSQHQSSLTQAAEDQQYKGSEKVA